MSFSPRALLRAVHDRIPVRLRRILRLGLLQPWRRLRYVYRQARPQFCLAEKRQGTSGPSLAVLCASEDRNRSFLLGQILGRPYRERGIGRAWLWDAPKAARRFENCCAVLVHGPARVHRLLGPEKWLAIPAWVVGEVDLPLPPHVLTTRSVKDDLRRIRKSGLRFDVTRDLQDLQDFYHGMYVPYIRQSHGDTAFITSYDAMRECFNRCDLLIVSNQKVRIGGILIRYSDSGPALWSLGIRDGSREFVRAGAVGALYHFSFRHLTNRGFTKLGLGHSRAFLSDGALQYKKKMGMRLTGPFEGGGYFYLGQRQDTEAMRASLRANPFIFENDGGLYGVVFTDTQDALLGEESLRQIHKDFYIEGISRLLVVPLDTPSESVKVPSELAGRMRVCRVSEIFG